MSHSIKEIEHLTDTMLAVLLSLAQSQHQIRESLRRLQEDLLDLKAKTKADLDDLDADVNSIRKKIFAVTTVLDTMDSK